MPQGRTVTASALNGVNSTNATYSVWVGFIFIFNLIVGTGALTLPSVFAKSGWFLSLVIIILLACISYITVTFVIETIAAANAVKTWQNLQVLKRSFDFESQQDLPTDAELPEEDELETDDPSGSLLPSSHSASARLERIPLYTHGSTLVYYKLDKKFELGEMATLFLNDFGRLFFYLCISIYLYGDMSIYSAAVSKSLRDLFCDHPNGTTPGNFTTLDLNSIDAFNLANNDTDEDAKRLCWQSNNLTRLEVYRFFLVGFTVIFGPFVAFSVQKTKYLQILTVIFRWCAFIFMISIALKLLITEGPKGHPVSVNIYGVPALFGACVYSFMCHHSLPSLIAPIRDKAAVRRIICADYIVICLFYILLAMTGIFAFERLQDLYTLNFIPDETNQHSFKAGLLVVIDYFLALFPVFTLSASFPIIAITLRNNLQILFLDTTRFESYNYFVRRVLFPLMAIVPPFAITYFTENITSLVAFTGSYAGAGIQYIIPIVLVYYARTTCRELLGSGVVNDYQSPFRSIYWLAFVLMWALGCISLVTLNFFLNIKS